MVWITGLAGASRTTLALATERALIPSPYFLEVYCRRPLAVCEQRDPKGLYRKARAGMLPEFNGISSPYEAPETPGVLAELERRDILSSGAADL